MEDYFNKGIFNDLPKLNSNYSTWYKSNSLNKAKSISMKDLNTPKLSYRKINFNSKKKLLSPKNSISKFLKLKKNYNKNKPIKFRSSSVIKDNNLFEEETDDSLFALSQVKFIDNLITKRINKKIIWKEKQKNIYDINTSKNNNIIKKIRKKIVENRFENLNNFDLKSEIDRNKYFSIQKLNIINEANDIIKKMEIKKKNEKKFIKHFFVQKKLSIKNFAKQNRDICLKNNLINILNDEIKKLKTKEEEMFKVLEKAKNNLNKDQILFDEFILNHKKSIKNDEEQISILKEYNNSLKNEINKLNIAIKDKQYEIKKYIKNIILFYSYAHFIHTIIGNDQHFKNVNIEKLNNFQVKNERKDLNYLIQLVFEEFNFLLNDNNNENNTNNFIFDSDQMTYLFNSMETAILKYMEERDDILKEIEKEKIKNNSEVKFLNNRINDEKKDLNHLNIEKNKNDGNFLILSNDYKKSLYEAQKYIFEIYEELNNVLFNNKIKKENKNMENISKDTLNLLHKLEDKLISLINEMEKIKGNENEYDNLFCTIIEKVKNDNKLRKYKESIIILKKLEEEKKFKYQQRANRIKMRGAMQYIPPQALQKEKENKKRRENKGNNEEDLLYY